jgi:hypothetical protein
LSYCCIEKMPLVALEQRVLQPGHDRNFAGLVYVGSVGGLPAEIRFKKV